MTSGWRHSTKEGRKRKQELWSWGDLNANTFSWGYDCHGAAISFMHQRRISTCLHICVAIFDSRKETLILLSEIHDNEFSSKINRAWTRNPPTLFSGQHAASRDNWLSIAAVKGKKEGFPASACADAAASPGREGIPGGRGEDRSGERGRHTRTSRFIPSDPAWHALRRILPATGRHEIVFYDGTRARTRDTAYPFSCWTRRYRKLYPLHRSTYLALWNASIIMTSDMHYDLAIWIIAPSSGCYDA
jgi:hypothetical protein